MPDRPSPPWMSLLDALHAEEHVCFLRCGILLVFGLTVIPLGSAMSGTAMTVCCLLIAAGVVASLVGRARARHRQTHAWALYLHGGIDVAVVTGVVVVSLWGANGVPALLVVAPLPYALLILSAALRLHVGSTLFTAGFAALSYLGAAVLGVIDPFHLAGAAPFAMGAPVLVVLPPPFLAMAGGLAVLLIRRAQRGIEVNDEAARINRRVLNQVSDGLMVCSADGRIVEVNAAASDVVQLPRSVLVDLEAVSSLPAPLAQVLRDGWDETLTEGFVSADIVRLRNDDCDERVLEVALHRMRFGPDYLVGVVLRDVTAEHKLRDRDAHAERLHALRALAGGIAHEFNNMFASIDASSYVLADAIPNTAPEYTEVEIIREATSRASAMVRELLDLTDTRPPALVPMDVLTLIERALTVSKSSSPAPVAVTLDVAHDIRRVLGDEAQLIRALSNLIGCAYGAMLDGGKLTIRAFNATVTQHEGDLLPGNYVAIEVHDTGIGMPAEMVERAFDPFYASEGRRWSGFALANVRAVVTRHGGSIDLVSTLGRGTTHTVKLPATDRPSQALSAQRVSRPSHGSKMARLLVVDDEPANRHSLARLLSTRGYDVMLAEDGRTALQMCEGCESRFDLVLLDLVMPGLSGKDVLSAMRARYPDTKVMVVTGYADKELVDEALDLGASGFANKPFDIPQLLEQIQSLTRDSPAAPLR